MTTNSECPKERVVCQGVVLNPNEELRIFTVFYSNKKRVVNIFAVDKKSKFKGVKKLKEDRSLA